MPRQWKWNGNNAYLEQFKGRFSFKAFLWIEIVGTNLCLGIWHKSAQNLAVHSSTTCHLQSILMVEGVIYFFFLWNLFLKSNLSWLVLNDANRRRSTIHWIRCITFKMSQCSIINHLCSNSYQICSLCTLFFWRPPEAASNAALSTYPYWRFLTHSAWSGRTRYFLLSLPNRMITFKHTYMNTKCLTCTAK